MVPSRSVISGTPIRQVGDILRHLKIRIVHDVVVVYIIVDRFEDLGDLVDDNPKPMSASLPFTTLATPGT
jgi:hypothetical protein